MAKKSTIEELLVSLGYEVDEDSAKELGKFEDALQASLTKILKISAAVTGAAAAISFFVLKMSQSTEQLGIQSETLGVSVETLEGLAFAMEKTTGSSDGLIASLQNFRMLTGSENPLATLLQTAKDFQGLDEISQVHTARQLGLESMLLLLRQGPEAIQELIDKERELSGVTQEDTVKAKEFMNSLRDIWRVVRGISVSIASQLSPALRKVANQVSDWWEANDGLVKQQLAEALSTLGKVLSVFFQILLKGISLAFGITQLVGGLNVALKFVLGTLLLFLALNIGNAIMAVSGLVTILIAKVTALGIAGLIAQAKIMAVGLTIGALIILIIALVDDIITELKGGESLLGNIIDKVPEIETYLMPLALIINFILDLVGQIVTLLTDPLDPKSWKTFFSKVGSLLKTFIDDMGVAVIEQWKLILKLIVKGLNLLPGVDISTSNIDDFTVPKGFSVTDELQNLFNDEANLGALQGLGASALAGGQPKGNLTGNTKPTILNQHVTINAPASTAAEISAATKQAMLEANRASLNDLIKGVEK